MTDPNVQAALELAREICENEPPNFGWAVYWPVECAKLTRLRDLLRLIPKQEGEQT